MATGATTGLRRRVFCHECFNLKGELIRQIDAFSILTELNPNLKSDILVQNLREVLNRIVETKPNENDEENNQNEPKAKCGPLAILAADESVSVPSQILPQSSSTKEIEPIADPSPINDISLDTSENSPSCIEKDVVTSTSVTTIQITNVRKRKFKYKGKRKNGRLTNKRPCKTPKTEDREWDGFVTKRKSAKPVSKKVNYSNDTECEVELEHLEDCGDDNLVTHEEGQDQSLVSNSPSKSKLPKLRSLRTRKTKDSTETSPENSSETNINTSVQEPGITDGNVVLDIVYAGLGLGTNEKLKDAAKYVETTKVKTTYGNSYFYHCKICQKKMTVMRNACLHVMKVHLDRDYECEKCTTKLDQSQLKLHIKKCDGLMYHSSYKSPFNSAVSTPDSKTDSSTVLNAWKSPDDPNDLCINSPFPEFDLKKTLSAHVRVEMLKHSQLPPIPFPSTVRSKKHTRRKKSIFCVKKTKGTFQQQKKTSVYKHKSIASKKNKIKNINTSITSTTTPTTTTNIVSPVNSDGIVVKKRGRPRLNLPKGVKQLQAKSQKLIKLQRSQIQNSQPRQKQNRIQNRQQKKKFQNNYVSPNGNLVTYSEPLSISAINGLNPSKCEVKTDELYDPNNPPVFARKSKPNSSNPPPSIPVLPDDHQNIVSVSQAWNSYIHMNGMTTYNNNNVTPSHLPITPNRNHNNSSNNHDNSDNSIMGIERDNWDELEMNASHVIHLGNSGTAASSTESIFNTFSPYLSPPSVMNNHEDHDRSMVSGFSHQGNHEPIPLLPLILPFPPSLPGSFGLDPNSPDFYALTSPPVPMHLSLQADSTSANISHSYTNQHSATVPYNNNFATNSNTFSQNDGVNGVGDDGTNSEGMFDQSGENPVDEDEDYEAEEEEEEEEDEDDNEESTTTVIADELKHKKGHTFYRERKNKAKFEDVCKKIRQITPSKFECTLCKRLFKIRKLAVGHIRRLHLREQEVICVCMKKFTNLGSLRFHVKTCTLNQKQVLLQGKR